MKISNGLPEYLSGLPVGDLSRFEELSARVDAVQAPASIASFVFLPNQVGHPEFDDAAEVFWQAVTELYLKNPRSDGELPLVYWGFHSLDLLLRRSSNGVLVTDRTLYLVDAGRSSAAFSLVDVAAIRVEGDDLRVDSKTGPGASLGLAQAQRLLEPDTASDAVDYLTAVLAALPRTAEAPAAGLSAAERISRSNLSSDFQLAGRASDAKSLAKLASKWKLPTTEPVLFALSSATFAGVYGLAVTASTLYSRDLMEPLESTALADVDPAAIHWDAEAKHFRVNASQTIPALPSITDDNREYFLGLLGELLG